MGRMDMWTYNRNIRIRRMIMVLHSKDMSSHNKEMKGLMTS